MTSPYTANPLDAFLAAETSVALTLVAIVCFRPTRSWASRVLLVLAIFLTTAAPSLPDLIKGLGYEPPADFYLRVLSASAAVTTIAMLFSSPRWLAGAALVLEYALYKADHFFTQQDLELCALHLIAIGALIGLEKLTDDPPLDPPRLHVERSYWRHDLALGALGMILAAIVCVTVLKRECDSADEWAYTFQAEVFAKLRAYSREPACYDAFQNFWVFRHDGKVFAQYMPGWPLVMAPFAMARAIWLAGPFGLAVLVVAIARLGRRAAAAMIDVRDAGAELRVRLGGTIAAASLILSDTILINGASRFPHLWVDAMFAWAVEAICMVTSPLAPKRQTTWGAVLGVSLAWLLATRHIDGCLLGVAMFLYCVYALARRRLPARVIGATLVAAAIVGGFFLIVLRIQMGRWFATGYALTEEVHPWNKFAMSVPKPHEWRWGIPIGTGAYSWFPMAPAIGIAGMLALGRTRERRLPFMLCIGPALSLAFYTAIEYGRGWDFGYGPRYQLSVVVPMAVGAAPMLAPLFEAALRRATRAVSLFEAGPAAVTIAAALVGAVRIAPLVYPYNTEDIRLRNGVNDAIKKDRLSNAIVWIHPGVTIADWLDLTQNHPPDLYANTALILRDVSPQVRQCVQDHYPGRRWYRAEGRTSVRIVPE